MQESKRSLLKLFSVAAAFSFFTTLARSQDPFPSSRQRPAHPGEDDANLPEEASSKVVLEENQKDIKKNVEKLFDLASQLREQVEKTDSTTTLSLALVKKAEEIEKLARQIKERAKG